MALVAVSAQTHTNTLIPDYKYTDVCESNKLKEIGHSLYDPSNGCIHDGTVSVRLARGRLIGGGEHYSISDR